MKIAHDDDRVEVTMQISPWQAERLYEVATANFYCDQPGRFESEAGTGLPMPFDPVFEDGSMYWCACMSDALLLCSFEEATGHVATLVWDLAAGAAGTGGHVVVSSRPYTRPR